jgi:hypothetical protein
MAASTTSAAPGRAACPSALNPIELAKLPPGSKTIGATCTPLAAIFEEICRGVPPDPGTQLRSGEITTTGTLGFRSRSALTPAANSSSWSVSRQNA